MKFPEELELYIHIPFCEKKCNYCDFLSFSGIGEEEQDRYCGALTEEIQRTGAYLYQKKPECDFKIRSIFVGGGTPSILKEGSIEHILTSLKEVFPITAETEITMEANPGTLTGDKLEEYRKAGINRLSIGLQSAENKSLALLGRIHTWEVFLKNYELARKKGFSNINIDLMSSLPGQTLKEYERTLSLVTELSPEHISSYSLILEEGTVFYQSKDIRKMIPDEETDRQMYQMTKDILRENGYHRYEISNYARPGKECIHNLGYWSGVDYLGFGLGASSYFGNTRFSGERDLKKYIEVSWVPFSERKDYTVLTEKDQMEEFMFLGLRKMEGISYSEFFSNFGVPLEKIYGPVIRKYEEMNLLESEGDRLFLTDAGIDVSDYIFCDFML